jgi:NAD(P)-dependent dehydrogenase (short-subunit alcohol dehydrogenase family)
MQPAALVTGASSGIGAAIARELNIIEVDTAAVVALCVRVHPGARL